ncbi:hypothetical protein LXL04_038063 [Taraxacum kok-saghyz]
MSKSFIRIDVLTKNPSRSTYKYHLINSFFHHHRILQTLFNEHHTLVKQVHVHLFKLCTCKP